MSRGSTSTLLVANGWARCVFIGHVGWVRSGTRFLVQWTVSMGGSLVTGRSTLATFPAYKEVYILRNNVTCSRHLVRNCVIGYAVT